MACRGCPSDGDAGPHTHERTSPATASQRDGRSAARRALSSAHKYQALHPSESTQLAPPGTHYTHITAIKSLGIIEKKATSSRMLALAVLAALFAGAICAAPTRVKFTMQKGSDAKKLVLKVEYTRAGDTLSEMELRQHGSEEWEPFTKKGGDVWEVSSSKPLVGPFNFRFLSKGGMKNVFDEVFSTDFKIGKTYKPEYDA